MKTVINFCISVVVLVLITYGVMYFFDVDTGRLIDWGVGLGAFLWIMVIVTVPWNAHFKAREVLDDAEVSQRKGIIEIEGTLEFAKRVAKRSLWMAIALHVFSAIGLYLVASLEVSSVGYFAAAFAALLTFFRPSVRFYEYLTERLAAIKQEFRYPREDIQELLRRVDDHTAILDDEKDVDSWRNQVMALFESISEQLNEFQKDHNTYVDENDKTLNEFQGWTKEEFSSVRNEHSERLAKITADSQILDSVRELAGFVKELKG